MSRETQKNPVAVYSGTMVPKKGITTPRDLTQFLSGMIAGVLDGNIDIDAARTVSTFSRQIVDVLAFTKSVRKGGQ